MDKRETPERQKDINLTRAMRQGTRAAFEYEQKTARRALTAIEQRLVAAILLERFPLLGTDDEIDGADTVDALNQLYADLGDTKQFVYVDEKATRTPKKHTANPVKVDGAKEGVSG